MSEPIAVAAPCREDEFAAAVQRYQAGAYDEAAALFAALRSKAPEHPTALRLHGLALVRAGKVEAGLPLLERAREAAPGDALAQLHYGIGLQAARRFAAAAEMFRAARKLLPGNPAPPLNLAAALLELGEVEAAGASARDAVALAPGAAEAHYTLGLALMAAGSPAEARAAFAEAVRLERGFADGWVSLGLARYQLGDVGGAMQAMEQALAARPGHSVAEANLAVFVALRGEQQEAIERLRTVLARDPACVAARVNLASQLMIDREPKEALEVLAGAPPPGRLGVHWQVQKSGALIALRRSAEARAELDAIAEPPGDAEILILWRRILFALEAGDLATADSFAERMAALAVDENAALLEHRVIAHFDLARYRLRRGARARGFEHWRQGHALLSRTQPFSRDHHAAFIDTSIEAYGRERLCDGSRADNDDPAPLFIVGLPRSGTTLMEQILAAHPAVHGAGERSDVHNCILRVAGPALRAETVRKTAALDGATLSTAARSYLADLHALAPAARYVADKMPGNALHLGFMATLLPRARVIVCERDPRDIGLSIFQFRFFGYHPYAHDLADLGWYIGQHQRLIDHWRTVLPLPMLSVGLAAWVDDFTGTLRRVLEFLELPYDAACERFYAQERKVRTASVDQVRRPVNARGIGRWRPYAEQLEPLFAELDAAGVMPNDVACARTRFAVLRREFRPAAAFRVLEKANKHAPGTASIVADMALARLETGDHEAARALAEEAVTLAPEAPWIHATLCNVLAYCPGVSGTQLTAAMRRCGALWLRGGPPLDSRPPGKRLRVGLLGRFQRSPVTALTEAAFAALDRERFELVCFSAGTAEDAVTARFRGLGAFHELSDLDATAVAKCIRAEAIDALIELSGYLRFSCLPVLALRPAPVQIKWAGDQYHTTGIAEVDYLITDARETPPSLAPLYTERLLVMPESYACWTPPEDAPEPGAAPLAHNGFVTFGSFNSMMKITAPTIAVWSRVLAHVPDSRLLLAAPALGEAEVAETLRAAFVAHGIDTGRLELRGPMPQRALLAAYREIDIALSPFPYNAGVSLLEGLWMGVPAVALSGESFASRHGASHLAAVGLADWAVASEAAYVARAAIGAADPALLAGLRGSLRATVRGSALCDAPAFARVLGQMIERAVAAA